MSVDVEQLRTDARERAAARSRVAFDGEITDADYAGVPVRRYAPAGGATSTLVYLHGGYGLFGDLDSQDAYCRHLAAGLGVDVVSVEYRLAPEASLAESVADALTVVDLARADGVRHLLLGGDSAGGAVACLAAQGTQPVDGLLLTNPMLDLSLTAFDESASEGPDLALTEYAIRTWCRIEDLAEAPELRYRAELLPPCLLLVGERDALLPEARAFAAACTAAGVRNRLVVIEGAGHGFVATIPERVVDAARAFFEPGGEAGAASGYVEGSRTDHVRDRSAMKGHVAEASVIIAAPPERVWAALTDPDQVRQYLMGTDLQTDWQPGSPITWSGEYEGRSYVDKGEVLQVEDGKRLTYTHYSPLSGVEDTPDNYHTLFWSLEEVSGGTQLTLNQDNNSSTEEADHNRENWQGVMQGLKKLAEA